MEKRNLFPGFSPEYLQPVQGCRESTLTLDFFPLTPSPAIFLGAAFLLHVNFP